MQTENYSNDPTKEYIVKPPALLVWSFVVLELVILFGGMRFMSTRPGMDATGEVVMNVVVFLVIIDLVFLRTIKINAYGIEKGGVFYSYNELIKVTYNGKGHINIFKNDGKVIQVSEYDTNIRVLLQFAENNGVPIDETVKRRLKL